MIEISGSLIRTKKILMELIFNPCGEFRRSPEVPVSQIHSLYLHVSTHGIFSDILRHVKMLKRVWVRKATGSYRTYSSLVTLQPWFLSSWWKTCLWRSCSLGSCACSEGSALGQNTLMMICLCISLIIAINLSCFFIGMYFSYGRLKIKSHVLR